MKTKSKALIYLSFVVLTFCGIVPRAAAQHVVVESMDIIGNRRIPADTIRARIFTREGDVYDEASLQRDFSSLWNSGLFEDLRFEREQGAKGWRIHIYVKEKPTIRSIEYKGLNSVTQSDVLDRFKERKVGLAVENQYDPTKIKKAEVALTELLAAHGRQFATIRSEVRPIPPAAVGITFVIKEGPKVKVGKIKFEGNKKVGSRTLRGAMKNLKPIGIPHSIFFEALLSRTFDSTKLQEDAERVRDAYQQRGFFRALVNDPETKIRDTGGSLLIPFKRGKGKRVDITMPVEEGERYHLGKITFKNGKAITNLAALRAIFPMKDGDIFNTANVRKGLEDLRKAYGELGYINFTSVPDTKINDETKTIDLEIDLDEGKPYSVRRIEFSGNTTTRDKVIRRELALEEGNTYNNRLWELSLLRLNQLQYFEPLKPEQDTELKRNDQEATVDINLKVKEKGKNSIGLTGGVSGLSGSFVGLNYETNNFLGLGETLRVEANVGSRQRNLLFGFTEPYLFDRPLQFGFTVFTRRFDFNQARDIRNATNQNLNLPQNILDTLQNFSTSSTGFTVSGSYPLRRSFKRVGLTYSYDSTSVNAFNDFSRRIFEQLSFRNISGPSALQGVKTSKLLPSFTFNKIDNPQRPHTGSSLFIGGDIAGIGGNVSYIRPVMEWKQFIPMRGSHTLGYRLTGSFITGYRGLVAPPDQRFRSGGENDIRGFDNFTVGPYVFIVSRVNFPLVNPDDPCVSNPLLPCAGVPIDPTNPRKGIVTVPIPVRTIAQPGGDTNLIGNVEYRVPIAGPVSIAAFTDFGLDFIARGSQLRISDAQFQDLNSTSFGCPTFTVGVGCSGGGTFAFKQTLDNISGTNYVPRMSSGLELQVILPIVNAPFRIFYAYNPLRLDTSAATPSQLTREMFPAGGAGDITFLRARQQFAPEFRFREPRSTFRFTVATTF